MYFYHHVKCSFLQNTRNVPIVSDPDQTDILLYLFTNEYF